MVFKRLNLDLYTITVQGFFIISPILSFSEKKPDLDCKVSGDNEMHAIFVVCNV